MKITQCLFALALCSPFVGCDAENPVEHEESLGDETNDDGFSEESGDDDWLDSDGEQPMNPAGIDGFNADIDPSAVGFPTGSCRGGFNQPKSRICVTPGTQSEVTYSTAQNICRGWRSRVCTREDYSYIYSGPNSAFYNAKDRWLGNTVGDDQALCGNRDITSQWDSDRFNFDGTCNVSDHKKYRCCHDDE